MTVVVFKLPLSFLATKTVKAKYSDWHRPATAPTRYTPLLVSCSPNGSPKILANGCGYSVSAAPAWFRPSRGTCLRRRQQLPLRLTRPWMKSAVDSVMLRSAGQALWAGRTLTASNSGALNEVELMQCIRASSASTTNPFP